VPETYYEILGVPADASDREIKEAYRLLARKIHPDVCGEAGTEDRFKQVNEAYRILSDPGERGRYDALGHENYRLYRSGPHVSPPGARGPAGFQGFGDAFDLFFAEKAWGSPRAFRPKALSDILIRLEVTLEEAVLGSGKEVMVPYAVLCRACGGTGSTTGKAAPCPRCGGSGREGGAVSPGPVGDASPPCRECGGRGRIPGTPCETCEGWGATQETRRVPVHIPPGIESGMRIRKEGLGDRREAGTPRGDLYIEVVVLPHDRFTRKGDDLELPLHLSPARAALGTIAGVVTLRGNTVQVMVPPGVQHGDLVRVRGEGVKVGDRSGDLVLRILIDTPEGITAEEQDLYRRILRIEERREGTKAGVLSRCMSRIRGAGR
jgi:molecular chaperone DnaJ